MRRLWRCALPTNPAPLIFASGVASLPRVYDVIPNSGPAAGGTAITIRGQGFTGAIAVALAHANPGPFFTSNVGSLVVVDDFTITCTTPADAIDPFVSVWVRTAAGVGSKGTLARGAFTYAGGVDPTTLAFNLAIRGPYAGAPWNGITTAGTSGSNYLDTAGADPTVGTALNGYATADFNGSKLLWGYVPGPARMLFSDILGNGTSYYFASLVYIRSAPAPAVGGDYLNPLIVGDDGGAMGLAVSSSGIMGFHLQAGSAYVETPWQALSLNAWHFVEWWWDGTNMHTAVDGVSGTATAATAPIVEAAEHVQIGANYASTGIDGLLEELWAAPSDLSAHSADMISYVNARYGLSL